jgi:hypothetical protein
MRWADKELDENKIIAATKATNIFFTVDKDLTRRFFIDFRG